MMVFCGSRTASSEVDRKVQVGFFSGQAEAEIGSSSGGLLPDNEECGTGMRIGRER